MAELHSPSLAKVAIVKGEEILVLFIQPLQRMCLALGEIPNIPVAKSLDLILSVLVDGRHEDGTLVYNSPFRLIRVSGQRARLIEIGREFTTLCQ